MNMQPLTKLEKQQFKNLEAALISAFPRFDAIKRLYRLTFNENLESITNDTNLETVAFNIIEWAESQGKLNELIKGAYEGNPTNPQLEAFVNSLKVAEVKKTAGKKSNASKYFKPNILISDIKPVDIMGWRGQEHKYKDFYYARDFDEDIYDLATKKNNILIIGNSLAGKTRALLELIKKISKTQPNTYILFPQNEKLKGTLGIPLEEGYQHIAFIEDIDDYYYDNDKTNRRNYDKMIQALVEKKVQIFATCRTGPEYKEYKRLSKSKVREIFTKIQVNKIERKIIDGFDEAIIGDIEQSSFDGNIGSIFMDIQKMRDRYDELERTKTPEAQLAIQIMRSIKAFYFASNFMSKSTYHTEAVKDYCLRLTVGKYASDKKIVDGWFVPLKQEEQKKKAKDIKKFNANLSEALNLLESDEDNLNFIKQIGHYIEAEEVYLEKIVRYNPITINKNINDLYDGHHEKAKNGFFVKTNNYNKLFSQLPYQEAETLFYKMRKQSIVPNADTYGILIEKSENYTIALKWYKVAEKRTSINSSILSAMIGHTTNFEEAFGYVEKVLNSLLEEAKENAEIDLEYQILTDNILHLLMNNQQVERYFIAFWERGIVISSFVFNRIIRIINDINICLKLMNQYQIVPDYVSRVILIGKSSSLEQGLDLLNDKRFDSLKFDTGTLNGLIGKATSLTEGLDLLNDKRFDSLKIDTGVLNCLVERPKGTSELHKIIKLLEINKLAVNLTILKELSNRLSYYKDLEEFPIFFQNYKEFQGFNFFDMEFKAYEEVLDYLKNSSYKGKFLRNHLLYQLLHHQLIISLEQKEEFMGLIQNNYMDKYGLESYEQIKDTFLFPDIQEMLDNYQIPNS